MINGPFVGVKVPYGG